MYIIDLKDCVIHVGDASKKDIEELANVLKKCVGISNGTSAINVIKCSLEEVGEYACINVRNKKISWGTLKYYSTKCDYKIIPLTEILKACKRD